MTYFDRRGKQITKLEFDTLKGLDEYKQVARYENGKWRVHTDWNGYDEDRLFTTYVFNNDNPAWGLMSLPSQSYRTESDAIAGHHRVVKLIEAIVAGDDQGSLVDRIHAALEGRADESIEWAKSRTERSRRSWF